MPSGPSTIFFLSEVSVFFFLHLFRPFESPEHWKGPGASHWRDHPPGRRLLRPDRPRATAPRQPAVPTETVTTAEDGPRPPIEDPPPGTATRGRQHTELFPAKQTSHQILLDTSWTLLVRSVHAT